MYTMCSTEKSAEQQRKFESTMLTMLLEQPYDTITISELCRRAGYSRRIFYRLFEQKADVIYACVDHTVLGFQKFSEDGSGGEDGMKRFFSYWKDQKHLLDALEASKTSTLLMDLVIKHVLNEDPDVLRDFGAENSPYSRETIVFFLSGLFALVLDWYRRGYDKSVEEMADCVLTLLTTKPVKVPID